MNFPFPSTRVPGIHIDRISIEEVAQSANFLSTYWDSDSPVPNILRLEQTPLQHQWNQVYVQDKILSGVCLEAVTESGEIVGAAFNKVVYRNGPSSATEQQLAKLSSMLPQVQTHNKLLKKLFDEASLFSRYDVSSYMDFGRIYVKPEFRRQKLSLDLSYTVIGEAQQTLGIELFVIVATSAYSQRACREDKNYAFELVHEIDFSTYKDGDEYPFRNNTIHQSMQLYAMMLPFKSRQVDKQPQASL